MRKKKKILRLLHTMISNMAIWLVQNAYRLLFWFFGKLPADHKLVIFESFFGRQYSCNPRAIYEHMKNHCPEYRLIWVSERGYEKTFNAHHLPYVRRYSLHWVLLMGRAGYWVTNIRFPEWFHKPAHTIYLQTWHGTPLKKLALDTEEYFLGGTTVEQYKKNFVKESGMWDYLVSPNRYSSEIFTRAFGFNGTMIETGYPRNDFLYRANDHETIEQIKERCGLPKDKKIILYAPTWRDDQFYTKGKYKFKLDLDLKQMRATLGKDYLIIIRLHYLIADQLDLSGYRGFAYDFSRHEDIRELYLISDLLITDYSSVFFDYANLKRPMIFFTYDLESYKNHLRGFYFDFERMAPGPIVRTTGQVIKSIRDIEDTGFAVGSNFVPFFDQFCDLEDGHASERVVNRVFNHRSS